MSNTKTAVVLLNLGTPNSPTPKDVGTYLNEFLMDPLVIDIPFLARWFLIKCLIVPRRSKTSAEAYQKVWTKRGSPLLTNLIDLTEKVKEKVAHNLPDLNLVVEPCMRYGNPGVQDTFARLLKENPNLTDLVVLPLYPQYSLAATESSKVEVLNALERLGCKIKPRFLGAFYNRAQFLDSFTQVIQKNLNGKNWDHLLMSFHGLPERQVQKTDTTGTHCFKSENCCDKIGSANQNCYRAQCFETARQIAKRVGLEASQYTVCFQSRLGRTPWIKPYTDVLYVELAQKGIKKIAVTCPAFVSDCLETLEEITIRGKQSFLEAGGEDLFLIPSLNSEDIWANAVTTWITEMTRSSTT